MVRPLDVRTSPRAEVPTSQQRAVEEFWRRRQEEIKDTVNFNEHEIPMARLKKIFCAQKGSMMMTFDTPAFMSKACELFVQELAIRAWISTESHHRCVILESDIAEAIATTESYDFLVDILHAHSAEHNSTPHPRPIRKRRRSTDQSSTSFHPPHRHQVPQFAGYAPHIPIPPSPMPTVIDNMQLSFPFLLQEAPSFLATTVISTATVNGPMPSTNCITRGSDFFGSNINTSNNNNALVPNAYLYMNMGNAGEQGGLAFNHLFPLQFPCPLPVTNNNVTAVATTIELNHILLEDAETNSTIHASGTANGNSHIDVDSAICVDGQLHQHEKEIIINRHQNVVHESVDVETIVVADARGNRYNINGDEVERVDESLLDKFLEEIQINEDLLSLDTTSDDILPLISTILDAEEFINDPYVLDDVFSNPSTNTNNN